MVLSVHILLFIHTPDSLYHYTYVYLWWIFISLPASFLYNMYASALRSSGDTIAALIILAIAVAFNYGRNYLLIISVFYLFCFLGNSFTGYFNGTENVIITLAGSITQITIRVVFSFFLFKTFKLNAVAISTGIGWILANIFWLLNWKFNGKLHLPKKKIE